MRVVKPYSIGLFLGMILASRAYLSRAAEVPSHERPNILLIVADDLGWGDVGWHGGFAQTPCLDRLVREGVELNQHYVQPVCTPTRTALLSGRYPGRFGPQALAPSNLRAMPVGTTTLASALRSVGYHTYQAGKWHLGSRQEWGPTMFGFEHSYGTLTGAADPWNHRYRPGPYLDTWQRDGQPLQESGNATELIAAEACRRMEEKQTPWFMYVPFHAVHTPVDAPPEYFRPYAGQVFDAAPDRQASRMRLAAMISQLDAKVAQFVELLERTGQRQRTLLVFMSDNGGIESLKNAYVSDVPDSPLNSENAPLRGQKNTLYEGGIRVCAFAHWPRQLSPHVCNRPIHAVDWFPTLARLCGYHPETDLNWDGIDVWPAIQGTPAAASVESSALPERSLYIATDHGAALRHGDWKVIELPDRPPQLYQLSRDPYETSDQAAREPAKLREMQQLLRAEQARDVTKLPDDLVGWEK